MLDQEPEAVVEIIEEAESLSIHSVALRLLPAVMRNRNSGGEWATAREVVEEAYKVAAAFVEERDRRVEAEWNQRVDLQEEISLADAAGEEGPQEDNDGTDWGRDDEPEEGEEEPERSDGSGDSGVTVDGKGLDDIPF